MLKVPYMAVIGDKEVEDESLAMRKHGKKNIGTISVEEAAVNLNKEKIQTEFIEAIYLAK